MVVVDADSDPYIHVSGSVTEVCSHLKDQNVPEKSVISIWFNGSDTSVIYRR